MCDVCQTYSCSQGLRGVCTIRFNASWVLRNIVIIFWNDAIRLNMMILMSSFAQITGWTDPNPDPFAPRLPTPDFDSRCYSPYFCTSTPYKHVTDNRTLRVAVCSLLYFIPARRDRYDHDHLSVPCQLTEKARRPSTKG